MQQKKFFKDRFIRNMTATVKFVLMLDKSPVLGKIIA
jgi:hypothetical protein